MWAIQPAYVGYTVYTCGMPAYVGCKLRAAKVGLSTHDSRIYTDS